MRVLFVTRGSSGHLMPLVPIARAAQRAGHEVLVAAQRGLAANVERTGLPLAAFDGPPAEAWMGLIADFAQLDLATAHDVMIRDYFGRLDTEAALPGLRATVERWQPDALVRDSWEFASTIVAEERGIPLTRVGLGLAELEAQTVGLVEPVLEPLGLPRGRLGAAPYVTTMPEALEDPAVPAPPVTHRLRHESGVPGAPDADADPLVYLTFGSVTAGAHLPYYPAVYRAAIDALAPLPIRLLVTTGEPRDLTELGPLPPNVRVEHWIPQDEIAPQAIVCHGGHGTILGAMAAGVPLVVLPLFGFDQAGNARAVARAGAGVDLGSDPSQRGVFALPAMDGLAPAVAQVLADGAYRRSAAAIAAAMRELPPVDDLYRTRTRTERERPVAHG